jgi:hypothetical protein
MPATVRVSTKSDASIRALARRRGLSVQKCRSRNPQLPGFGMYRVIDPYTNRVAFGAHPHDYSATLEEIAAFLRE